MVRALFLALGLSCCILGAEFLAIETAVLHQALREGGSRSISPPEWAPWSLLSGGIVVLLYSFTIPRRAQG